MQVDHQLKPLSKVCNFVRDETSCSTDLCEKAHGSGAVLTKNHELFNEKKLRATAVNHQCRSMFQHHDLDTVMTRVQASMDKVNSKQRISTAYECFLSSRVTGTTEGGVAGVNAFRVQQARVKQANQQWR